MSAPDKRDAATRAMDKLIEQKILEPFQRYNMGQVIRQEYAPLIEAARKALTAYAECYQGDLPPSLRPLREALAHIEGDATP